MSREVIDGLQHWIARQFVTDDVLIIDDTGFPNQGKHSIGVARQYTVTLGKVASCQVAVTMHFATAMEIVGLKAQLYIPAIWTENVDRVAKAGVCVPPGPLVTARQKIASL